jgi:hypothetical protein
MRHNIGQLVKIVDASDQPRWIRDFVGQVALIVDYHIPNISYSCPALICFNIRYKVLIEEKVYEVHPLDIEPLNDDDTDTQQEYNP